MWLFLQLYTTWEQVGAQLGHAAFCEQWLRTAARYSQADAAPAGSEWFTWSFVMLGECFV